MRRGDLYRVARPENDPRPARIYVVVSRDAFLEVAYSSAACVPVYSTVHGLETEVLLDERNGLKRLSAARCDEVTSLPRSRLTDFIGTATPSQVNELATALAVAFSIGPEHTRNL